MGIRVHCPGMTEPDIQTRFGSGGTCIHKGAWSSLPRRPGWWAATRPLFFPAFGGVAVGVPTAALEFETAGGNNFLGFAAAIRAFDVLGAHLDKPFRYSALGAFKFINRHTQSFKRYIIIYITNGQNMLYSNRSQFLFR